MLHIVSSHPFLWGHLTLQLRLPNQRIAVNLITAPDHTVEWSLMVLEQQVFPDGVVARVVFALELVGIDTGREAYTTTSVTYLGSWREEFRWLTITAMRCPVKVLPDIRQHETHFSPSIQLVPRCHLLAL